MTTETKKNYLKTQYANFIHQSRYARWLPKELRRETWEETVDRYILHFTSQFTLSEDETEIIRENILDLKVMPSMRALMTAGKAATRDNVAMYNCAYVAVEDIKTFSEIMYVLMCGTGMGFSVERQFINKLPNLPETLTRTEEIITVRDSKMGWSEAFNHLLRKLWQGEVIGWDLSCLREAGAPLKTFGGRSSGPAPLDALFKFAVNIFERKYRKGELQQSPRLSSIDCHDLVCKIADIVVVGGVRRSALISLSNLTDERMAKAKSGSWWIDNGQRALANNSVCYMEKPDLGIFMEEWLNLYNSKCGERGTFSRQAANKKMLENGRRKPDKTVGCNPCSEILLRSKQCCNLTEIVVRAGDTLETLLLKAEVATILGTLQATQTNFRFLSKKWKDNCEEERLLGVSLTGVMDHKILSDIHSPDIKLWLGEIKLKCIAVNKEWSDRLGINQATAITCVKPSGTVSQLVDSASGLHPRYSEYYTRTVRADNKDPLAMLMREKGFPCEVDVMKPESGLVFSFPIKSPESSIKRNDIDAMYQLEHWKILQDIWCEHKPSITVYYTDDNFMAVGQWLWENFDHVSGISLLPHSDHIYQQAPYQEIGEKEYLENSKTIPSINWSDLSKYESVDMTVGGKELACTGNACEIG